MIVVRSPSLLSVFVALLVLSALRCSCLHAEAPLSADEVIQKAVARAERLDGPAVPGGYSYTKLNVTEQLDASGKVRERKEKVYQICFRGGATSARLVTVNGHPPDEADLKKQSENETNVRQFMGRHKDGKGESSDSLLTGELAARYNFRLVGRIPVNGRPAYEIAFRPKQPSPPVHHLVDRLLNQLSGTIWIDAAEFEVARAQLQLGSEVDFLGGAVGCLKKLAYTVTRTRVADGLWLNSISNGDFEGRKLLDSMRIKTRSESRNFRPLPLEG